MNRNAATVGLAGAVLGAALASCDQPFNCTLIGCQSGLILDLTGPGFEPGLYTIALDADGQSQSCTLNPTDLSVEMVCEGTEDLFFVSVLAGEGFFVDVPSGPAQVDLTLIGPDDGVLLEESLSPEYTRVAPNGERCGPICEQAVIELDFG